ncbi:MAG: hypothetical protein ABEI96_04180 [Haloarculaceae archaeon]
MKSRTIVTLVLIAALTVPVASASTVPTHSADAPDAPGVANQVETATASESSGSSASAGGSTSSASATASSDDGSSSTTNYTRLYVSDRYHSVELEPGESDSFTVTVENGEDDPVTLSPHIVVPRVGERPVETSWVTVQLDDATLAAGAEREVTVEIDVPQSAELGRYHGSVAFTNETIRYPGRPPQPVHAVSFSTEVRKDPTVFVRSGQHTYAQIRAGDTYTHEIVVENTGDEAVPLNPEFASDRHRHFPNENTAERSWFAVDAPSEVPAGETATVTVTVSPPADASRGRYGTELTLGLKDPARPDDSEYWQRVNVRFQVWTQPDQPFEKSFDVTEGTENVTLRLSTGDRYGPESDTKPPSFDVTWVAPNGTTVDADRASRTTSGYVDLSGERNGATTQGAYATNGGQREFVYRVEDPPAGDWSVRIMPEHAVQFQYEIVRNEDG